MPITNVSQEGYWDENGNWINGPPPGSGNNSGGGGDQPGPNPFSIEDYANQYAQQRQGYSPHRIMQEGEVTYRDGVPGIMIKYNTPQGSSTEWTPIPGWSGGSNVTPFEFGSSGGPGGGSSNPYFNQLQSMLNAQGAAEAANYRNAIQQALIGFGLVPENFKDKFGALSDLQRELIRKNTESGISTYARLIEGKQEGIKGLINRLNARGLRRSGARGFGLRKNQLGFDRNFADSLQSLMQYINNAYGQYSSSEYQRQMQMLMAMMQYASGSTGSTQGTGGNTTKTSTTNTAAPAYSQVAGAGTFGPSQTDPAYNMGGGWWAT